MGKENMKMRVDNRMLETFKMRCRFLYAIFIWYEFILWPDDLALSCKTLGEKQCVLNKVPFWSASILMYIIEFTEIMCGQGRILTQGGMYFMGVYIALYSQEWATKWVKLGLNIVFDLVVAYNNGVWVKYGQEDFTNYKLHGKY